MIPIRDHEKSGKTPWVTYTLIAVNIVVFIYMMTKSLSGIESFIDTYAMIPAQIVAGDHLITLISSMFIHGGLGHIGGNMLFLNIFGDNLEDRLGHVKYLLFYLVCGLGASFLQIITDPISTIPNIGASGAIAGLMGGYLLLFPFHRIDVLFEMGPFLEKGTVPAFTILVYWFLAQMISGVGSLALPGVGDGVAYAAHVGGFITGYILIKKYKKKDEEKIRAIYWKEGIKY